MTFAVPANERTPQSLFKEQADLGARLMLTIPFGSSTEDMEGFVSVMGSQESHEPVVTFCVGKPTGGCVVSTIVFDGTRTYSDFIEKIHTDRYINFDTVKNGESVN
jgi:hypothetical protein